MTTSVIACLKAVQLEFPVFNDFWNVQNILSVFLIYRNNQCLISKCALSRAEKVPVNDQRPHIFTAQRFFPLLRRFCRFIVILVKGRNWRNLSPQRNCGNWRSGFGWNRITVFHLTSTLILFDASLLFDIFVPKKEYEIAETLYPTAEKSHCAELLADKQAYHARYVR